MFGGQVVVVTGGGSGIGRALCVGFAGDGAIVVAVGRHEKSLKETAELCGRAISWIVADLREPDLCAKAIADVIAQHGRIDVLVNSAGTAAGGPFLQRPIEEWADTIALNLIGVAACCKAALPRMVEQGNGRIINITSRAAAEPAPGGSAYAASKAGVSALTRSVAAELAGRCPNVLINDLIPGQTRTGMSQSGQDPQAVYPFVRDLALLPSGGPSGQVFFKGAAYEMFGAKRPSRGLASLWPRGWPSRKGT